MTRCEHEAMAEGQFNVQQAGCRPAICTRSGFLGGMTADKYSKITGACRATATRYGLNVAGWNRQGDLDDPASR